MERFAKPEAVHEDLLTALQALHLGQEQEMQGEGESGESEDPICVSDKSIESD